MKKYFAIISSCFISISLFAQTVNVEQHLCQCISADKTQILYAGIDNPVTIKSSVWEKSKVSVTNGKISTSSAMFGFYVIRPDTAGRVKVKIDQGLNNVSIFEFKVKELPRPEILKIDPADLSAMKELKVWQKDFEFDLTYKVTSFDVTRISKNGITSISNNGSEFSPDLQTLIKQLKKGDKLIFSNVMCRFYIYKEVQAYDLVLNIE